MSTTIYSFEPIIGHRAKILILGSMPGEASLAARQYYAHRRNAFWPIITQLLQVPETASYVEKITAIQSSPLALWDVLESCKRKGSLDSGIQIATQTLNDFQTFFSTHPQITHVFSNGGKAESSFKRHGFSTMDASTIKFSRLPSTSPANARLSLYEKCRIWHEMIHSALGNF